MCSMRLHLREPGLRSLIRLCRRVELLVDLLDHFCTGVRGRTPIPDPSFGGQTRLLLQEMKISNVTTSQRASLYGAALSLSSIFQLFLSNDLILLALERSQPVFACYPSYMYMEALRPS